MKFLIQKVNGAIIYDFSLKLIELINYYKWLDNENTITIKYFNTYNPNAQTKIEFKKFHKNYIPIGSVEFIEQHLKFFHGIIAKPINVPEELFTFALRKIWNGTNEDLKNCTGKIFIKSNDKVKGFTELCNTSIGNIIIPKGNYQYSEYVDIYSEWRAFIYKGELVGLKNYSGDFTLFPDVKTIKNMIISYKSAPIAYTLDVGINSNGTFVIEVHNFYSCGLYGYDYPALVRMLSSWYLEYVRLNK